MFKSFFKTSLRSLIRHRSHAFINILGLGAGIGVCLLIFSFIRFETSFEDFHADKDRIYRVLTEYHHSKERGVFYGAEVPQPLPVVLRGDLPELQASAGVFASVGDQVAVLGGNGETVKKFREKSGVFAMEPGFFDIFSFSWLAGDARTSLEQPNSVVLSKETAIRYFGDWQKAMGGTIRMNNILLLKVTGILATVPANTDFQIKAVIPFSILGLSRSSDWGSASNRFGCFLKLPPTGSAAMVEARLRAIAKKYRPTGNTDELVLQPIAKMHYYDASNPITNFSGTSISPGLVRTLWIVMGFILVIACINFVNLSTAQAITRSREIGVRKVLGSNAGQLKLQFLLETFWVVLLSVLLGIGILLLTLGPVGKLLEVPLSLSILQEPGTLGFLLCLILATTLLAGFYPALVLSRFDPVVVLKSRVVTSGKGGILLRRGLVVLQFTIAQVMIIAMLVLVGQMHYFRNGSMGFAKAAVVNILIPSDSMGISKRAFLRSSLTAIPGVESVSFNSAPPAAADNNWGDIHLAHRTREGEQLYAISKFVDAEYLPLYQIPLAAGRNFSSDTAHEFIITQSTLAVLGFHSAEEALNKEMSTGENFLHGPIVGVLRDFHSTSFKDKYNPVFLIPHSREYRMAAVKLAGAGMAATMGSIEALWNRTFPDLIFDYTFVDEAVAAFYKEENRQARLYKIISGLAIFLGCLGLLGLVSFMTTQRVKEIGIRKVLGASVPSIAFLFIREFVWLIGIAFLIAAPLGWYLMNKWLQDYAYRIDIGWGIFALSCSACLAIALATIGYTTLRAALANPVKSLRGE